MFNLPSESSHQGVRSSRIHLSRRSFVHRSRQALRRVLPERSHPGPDRPARSLGRGHALCHMWARECCRASRGRPLAIRRRALSPTAPTRLVCPIGPPPCQSRERHDGDDLLIGGTSECVPAGHHRAVGDPSNLHRHGQEQLSLQEDSRNIRQRSTRALPPDGPFPGCVALRPQSAVLNSSRWRASHQTRSCGSVQIPRSWPGPVIFWASDSDPARRARLEAVFSNLGSTGPVPTTVSSISFTNALVAGWPVAVRTATRAIAPHLRKQCSWPPARRSPSPSPRPTRRPLSSASRRAEPP